MKNRFVNIFLIVVFVGLNYSCNNDYYPKPRGYFRISMPEKDYQRFDTNFPYSFEYPSYSTIEPDENQTANPYWINIVFSQFKGKLHLSYKPIQGNLNQYLEDTRTMVMKHIPKASSIENNRYENKDASVYGLTYNISGVGAASVYQFFLTDSVKHFVRGALYFNVVPNNDSLAPVIEFVKDDINHLIETFEWNDDSE